MQYYPRTDYMKRKNLPRLIRYYTPLVLFAVDNFPTEIVYAHPRLASATVAQEARWAGNLLIENPSMLPKPHNTFALIWPLLSVKPLAAPNHVSIITKTRLDTTTQLLLQRLLANYPPPQPHPLFFTQDEPTESEPVIEPEPVIPLLSFDEVSSLCASALADSTTIEFHADLSDTTIDLLEATHRGLAIIPTGPNQYKAL